MALNFRNDFRGSVGGGRPVAQASFVKIYAAPPPPPPPTSVETLREEEIAAAKKKKKTRSLLDIDLNASPRGHSPAAAGAAAATYGFGYGKVVDRGGMVEKVVEDRKERRRRRWVALLDTAAIALIREYEGSLEREDLEFRAENRNRNPRKSGGGGSGKVVNRWQDMGGACGYGVELAAPPPRVHRSKRGRVVAVPNRYRDSVFGAAAEEKEDDDVDDETEEGEGEEFQRRRKSPAAVFAADRKSRRFYISEE